MTELAEIEKRLRLAVEGECDGAVPSLLLEYRRKFDEIWFGLPAESKLRSPLPGQALELIQWAMSVTKSERNFCAQRRKTLRQAASYAGRSEAGRRTWQMAG